MTEIMHGQVEEQKESKAAVRVVPCWSCKGPVREGSPFCQTCKSVQPPGQVDHFTRFGLVPRFRVDVNALERQYFDLQRLLHPDRFVTKSGKEKTLSQLQATSLNEAYETLKNPLRRADYLMHLHGTDVLPNGCNLVNDQELLMEAMEMREALLEADSLEAVDQVAKQAADDIAECISALECSFADKDWETACRLTTRLKYLTKMADETKAHRNKLKSMS